MKGHTGGCHPAWKLIVVHAGQRSRHVRCMLCRRCNCAPACALPHSSPCRWLACSIWPRASRMSCHACSRCADVAGTLAATALKEKESPDGRPEELVGWSRGGVARGAAAPGTVRRAALLPAALPLASASPRAGCSGGWQVKRPRSRLPKELRPWLRAALRTPCGAAPGSGSGSAREDSSWVLRAAPAATRLAAATGASELGATAGGGPGWLCCSPLPAPLGGPTLPLQLACSDCPRTARPPPAGAAGVLGEAGGEQAELAEGSRLALPLPQLVLTPPGLPRPCSWLSPGCSPDWLACPPSSLQLAPCWAARRRRDS